MDYQAATTNYLMKMKPIFEAIGLTVQTRDTIFDARRNSIGYRLTVKRMNATYSTSVYFHSIQSHDLWDEALSRGLSMAVYDIMRLKLEEPSVANPVGRRIRASVPKV